MILGRKNAVQSREWPQSKPGFAPEIPPSVSLAIGSRGDWGPAGSSRKGPAVQHMGNRSTAVETAAVGVTSDSVIQEAASLAKSRPTGPSPTGFRSQNADHYGYNPKLVPGWQAVEFSIIRHSS